MKNTLLITALIGILGSSYAQKTKVYTSPTAYIIKKNIVAPQGVTLRGDYPDKDYIIAYKKGFITKGEFIKDIQKEGEKYTFNVSEVPETINLDKEKLNTINFSRFKYKTDNYYYSISDSEAKVIMEKLNEELAELGFKVNIAKQTLFEEKVEKVDFNIGAEVVSTLVKTLGTSGYNISTVVKWIVYDMNKEKVVFNKTAFGYSNSKKAKKFSEEYKLALKDAMNSLIYDEEFQKITCSEVTEKEEKDMEEKLEIDFKEKLTESEDVLTYIKQATVTIKTSSGHGSGFFISSNGYILTNEHVIDGGGDIEVELSNGLIIDAKIIRESSKKDVALLKVTGKGFKSIPIFEDKTSAGMEVYAIGTPKDLALGQTVTKGIISGHRAFKGNTYIQTDVSINTGNSGGPLINLEGEVLGIVASKMIGEGIEGIGFGIPIIKALETLNIKH
ncbi:MAG: hypothetical protein COB15_07270 [Flavobacteriales bacterium]|nr:MAG: hypothetical protein COB15_07270 [Flavobacteriales bacterium]